MSNKLIYLETDTTRPKILGTQPKKASRPEEYKRGSHQLTMKTG
jgi:hypothetical protein